MGLLIVLIAGLYLVAFALYLRGPNQSGGIVEVPWKTLKDRLKEWEAPPRKGAGRILRRISGSPGTGVLAFGFILLNVVDLFLTLRILHVGGTELNPVLGVSLGFGVPGLAFHKTVVSASVAGLLCRLRMRLALQLATVGMAAACLFNAACLTFR